MNNKFIQIANVACLASTGQGCKIIIDVPKGGTVASSSGTYACSA